MQSSYGFQFANSVNQKNFAFFIAQDILFAYAIVNES